MLINGGIITFYPRVTATAELIEKKRYQMRVNGKSQTGRIKFPLWAIVLSLPLLSGEKSLTVVAGKLGDGTSNFF